MTIHLTNSASRKLHTPLRLSIMALPRAWEHGDGAVRVLRPDVADLRVPDLTDAATAGVLLSWLPWSGAAGDTVWPTPAGWVVRCGAIQTGGATLGEAVARALLATWGTP